MAILGSIPNAKLELADDMAISANSSAEGFGLIAQSQNRTLSSRHIKNRRYNTSVWFSFDDKLLSG
jgi:hypothetical protein